MFNLSNLEIFKLLAKMHVDSIQGGVIYLISEGDTITWKLASKTFDLKIFDVGSKFNKQDPSVCAIKEKKQLQKKFLVLCMECV